MTSAALAERWWIGEQTNRTVGLGYPNVCNTVAALGFVYALYAAWHQSAGLAPIQADENAIEYVYWNYHVIS